MLYNLQGHFDGHIEVAIYHINSVPRTHEQSMYKCLSVSFYLAYLFIMFTLYSVHYNSVCIIQQILLLLLKFSSAQANWVGSWVTFQHDFSGSTKVMNFKLCVLTARGVRLMSI